MPKVALIVLDGVGCGELPDAYQYGDCGSDSLGNTARHVGGLNLPNLERLGLGNITPIEGVQRIEPCSASYGKMAELSAGKDTTTGHWELMGIWMTRPFPTYPDGFGADLIEEFEEEVGRKVIGNEPASGTEIIVELGQRHLETGELIVYTSADSVFQVAAHEEVVPVDELYRACEVARSLLTGENEVCRVIARPFVGTPGNFVRTERRKDFSLPPPESTVLDRLKDAGFAVHGVGKIDDIFAGQGLTGCQHVGSNLEGIEQTIGLIGEPFSGVLFTNLIDFDMKFGHRNDPEGYAAALEEFDRYVPEMLNRLHPADVLIVTGDHGNDPTTPSTDHSREYVPLLVYCGEFSHGLDLGLRRTFADVGATISAFFDIRPPEIGVPVLQPKESARTGRG